jgi:tetratricopeptide (TPR) repeat protein
MARSVGEGRRVDALLDEAVAVHRGADDVFGLAVALQNLAEGLMEQNDFAGAYAAYAESQALHARLGHHHRVAITYGLMANAAIVQGDYDRAIRLASTSAEVAAQYNNTYVATGARWLIGLVQTLQADPAGVALLRPGLEIFITYQYVAGVAFSLEALAAQAALHGDPFLGGKLFGAAQALRETAHVPVTAAFQPDVERWKAMAQGTLSAEAWQEAVGAGRALTRAEAIALALTVGQAV